MPSPHLDRRRLIQISEHTFGVSLPKATLREKGLIDENGDLIEDDVEGLMEYEPDADEYRYQIDA